MRILVFRGGALGDFLVTLPALGLLREAWPQGRLELVGNARAGELGRLAGCLDAVHSQHEGRWGAFHTADPLPSALAGWLAEFDLVLNFWPDPEGMLARHFPVRSGQQFLTASALPTLAPAARHYCEPLRTLGLTTADFRSRLDLGFPRLPAPAGAAPLALHPGSGSPRKNWPAERWMDLIARLDEPLLLVLGEAEPAEWTARCAVQAPASPGLPAGRVGNRPCEIAANLPLPELARQLARCRLFIGHDSGVSHLAAAVGVPCVLLFGPTDPAMWAPPGEQVRILHRGETLDRIEVNDVLGNIGPTKNETS